MIEWMVEQHRVLGENPQRPLSWLAALTEHYVLGYDHADLRRWHRWRLLVPYGRWWTLWRSNALVQQRLDAADPTNAPSDRSLVAKELHIEPHSTG
jgi:hypothetical protein